MAAYAALVSLTKVIDLTMSQEHKYVHICSREQMMSLHEDIARLQDLLEHLSVRSHPSIGVLESRIRDIAYRLEDIIEDDIPIIEADTPIIEDDTPNIEADTPRIEDDTSTKISLFGKFTRLLCMRSSPVVETPSPVVRTPSPVVEAPSPAAKTSSPVAEASSPVAITPPTFDICSREIDILLVEAMVMKENNLGQDQDKGTSVALHPLITTSSSSEVSTAKLDLNEVPVEIMDWIFHSESKLQIVPITGMGGIGKTTIARAVYQHPRTPPRFDICSWVTVSQEFNVNKILRGLLPQLSSIHFSV